MIQIIPTNTCPPDSAELSRRTRDFAAFSFCVQLDVDDGVFAPEMSWPYREGQWEELETMAAEGKKLPYSEIVEYETHLMVEEPLGIGGLLARVGCKRVIPHIEAFEGEAQIRKAFASWKAAGASEVGLALLIDTPLSAIEQIVGVCDVVQLMSIAKLGYQGTPFEPGVIARVAELHENYPDLPIAVDGGVSKNNIEDLVLAGATRFGVGSAISKAPDPKAAYEELKTLAENAVH